MGKQSPVQSCAVPKLPCNALFISLMPPDRRQIYSLSRLAVIESMSPRVRRISSSQSRHYSLYLLGCRGAVVPPQGPFGGHLSLVPSPVRQVLGALPPPAMGEPRAHQVPPSLLPFPRCWGPPLTTSVFFCFFFPTDDFPVFSFTRSDLFLYFCWVSDVTNAQGVLQAGRF